MSSPVEELVTDLGQGAALLDKHGVNPHWASLLRSYAERLASGDRGAASELLKQFGGMGSLNDLLVSPMNGHRVQPDQVDAVNRELDQIRERLFVAAKALAS